MDDDAAPPYTLRDRLEMWAFRRAAGGLIPAGWFLPALPPPEARAARRGRLSLEIVSHCWRYSHLLTYQLSSLVLRPPAKLDVTMTVYHAVEDAGTVALLDYFGARVVPNVRWNWQLLERGRLFRRSIGRNLAARATRCDWIWFTDCDVVFHEACLDTLADALQGRIDALVYPREERRSLLLDDSDPMLQLARGEPRVVDIDAARFSAHRRGRATGPLQITHGDVARACGYCDGLRVYQRPAPAWAKAEEDRVYRWLLRTQGEPVDVPGVYRIGHAGKGRYREASLSGRLRGAIRKQQSRLRDRPRARP